MLMVTLLLTYHEVCGKPHAPPPRTQSTAKTVSEATTTTTITTTNGDNDVTRKVKNIHRQYVVIKTAVSWARQQRLVILEHKFDRFIHLGYIFMVDLRQSDKNTNQWMNVVTWRGWLYLIHSGVHTLKTPGKSTALEPDQRLLIMGIAPINTPSPASLHKYQLVVLAPIWIIIASQSPFWPGQRKVNNDFRSSQ